MVSLLKEKIVFILLYAPAHEDCLWLPDQVRLYSEELHYHYEAFRFQNVLQDSLKYGLHHYQMHRRISILNDPGKHL